MRSIIILLIFIILIGILFFSLFKQPIQANSRQTRIQLRDAEINNRQQDFFDRQLKRCRKDLFEEAIEFVDSLMPEINPKNELDTLKRRFRPDLQLNYDKPNANVRLEPLFTDIDSLEN